MCCFLQGVFSHSCRFLIDHNARFDIRSPKSPKGRVIVPFSAQIVKLQGGPDHGKIARMKTKNQQFRAFETVNTKALLKVLAPSVVLTGLFFAAPPAWGQGRFGDARQMAITAENLFGLSTETVTQHDLPPAPFADRTDTSTRIGFLFGSHEGATVPSGIRVGVHYFIIPSLSLGGTLGFESRGGSMTRRVAVPQGVGIATVSKQSDTAFVFLPKVGYALMFSDVLGFWFRGGLGYANDTSHPDQVAPAHDSLSFWLASAEALFVVAPVPHFGFYVGPGAELSFIGSFDSTDDQGLTTSYSASYRRFAIDTGLIGYFGL
jgi:hypothetical protein